ncbi:MAG TPA: hypothetical protein VK153_01010 [Candidatus Paceibacterota bacterium]|nr:hypothetical protein [Candidatus Paceibacterota bacterium]
MEKDIGLLKAGTKIVLTKKRIKRRKFFMLEIGGNKAGTLASDCKIGQPLFYKKCEDIHTTSNISDVFEEEGSLHIETESSVYSVRIVTDNNDEEFKKLILS